MAKPLDDRITAALAKDARAATVADLRTELSDAITSTRADHDRLHAVSIAATTPETEADAAADETIKLARKITRLEAKADALARRHDELLNSEARQAYLARYADIKERRDQLVTDLQEEWPKLAGAMIALIERIDAMDFECGRTGGYGTDKLISAEAVARVCQPNFYINNCPVTRLRDNNIEQIATGGTNRPAWTAPLNRSW